MNEANRAHAQRIIAELLKILPDLNNPEVTRYEMNQYDALEQVTERITLRLNDKESVGFYFERRLPKEDA